MAADSDSPVNATYWPVTGAMGAQPTCKQLVAAYDYNRGRAIASRFGALGPKGPSLVVVQDEAAFFLVDMSKANERTIHELMSNWYQVAVSGSDDPVSLGSPIHGRRHPCGLELGGRNDAPRTPGRDEVVPDRPRQPQPVG